MFVPLKLKKNTFNRKTPLHRQGPKILWDIILTAETMTSLSLELVAIKAFHSEVCVFVCLTVSKLSQTNFGIPQGAGNNMFFW